MNAWSSGMSPATAASAVTDATASAVVAAGCAVIVAAAVAVVAADVVSGASEVAVEPPDSPDSTEELVDVVDVGDAVVGAPETAASRFVAFDAHREGSLARGCTARIRRPVIGSLDTGYVGVDRGHGPITPTIGKVVFDRAARLAGGLARALSSSQGDRAPPRCAAAPPACRPSSPVGLGAAGVDPAQVMTTSVAKRSLL